MQVVSLQYVFIYVVQWPTSSSCFLSLNMIHKNRFSQATLAYTSHARLFVCFQIVLSGLVRISSY